MTYAAWAAAIASVVILYTDRPAPRQGLRPCTWRERDRRLDYIIYADPLAFEDLVLDYSRLDRRKGYSAVR